VSDVAVAGERERLSLPDALPILRRSEGTLELEPLSRAVSFVPGTVRLERLLRMFQDERRHMAIVVDEYGGTQGIVTLEDVLEERSEEHTSELQSRAKLVCRLLLE